jgi:hypothetical protein
LLGSTAVQLITQSTTQVISDQLMHQAMQMVIDQETTRKQDKPPPELPTNTATRGTFSQITLTLHRFATIKNPTTSCKCNATKITN